MMLLLTTNSERHGMAAMLALCCSLFVVPHRCEAQVNLVPNPSFELIDTCPQYPAFLGFQSGAVPEHWYSSDDTPDYFNACVDTIADVPTNVFGFQYALDGQAYSGIHSHAPWSYREMMGVDLLEPLVIGQTYYGSFWVNAAYGGPQQTGSACNNIGMLMTMEPYHWVLGMPGFTLRNYAQVYSEQVVADTAAWTLVSGSFVADSAYTCLVVGNHFSNANTTVQVLGPGEPSKAYVLVDGICVSADPLACPMVTGVGEVSSPSIALWPNPCAGLLRIRWGPAPVYRVWVSDIAGKWVAEVQALGKMEFIFDAHGWASGLYHVMLEGEAGKYARKFVVVH